GGTFRNTKIIIPDSATANLFNAEDVVFTGTTLGADDLGDIVNFGTLNIHGSRGLIGSTRIGNYGTINWLPALQIPGNAAFDPAAALRVLQTNSFTGHGLITGTILALITNDGGSIISNDGASLISNDGGSIVAQGGGNIVAQGGGNIVAQGGGNIISTNGGGFFGNEAPSGSVPLGFSQTGGETNLSACTIVGAVTLSGGTISGTGFIQGNLTNNGGYITPGYSTGATGVIGVIGNFIQGSNGTTIIRAGGGSGGKFDSLQVAGTASLGGTLDLKLINGYTPDPLDKLNP